MAACIKDIVFVIRNYMYPPELANTWENFMYQIVSPLDVGHNDAQVSLVQDTQVGLSISDIRALSNNVQGVPKKQKLIKWYFSVKNICYLIF